MRFARDETLETTLRLIADVVRWARPTGFRNGRPADEFARYLSALLDGPDGQRRRAYEAILGRSGTPAPNPPVVFRYRIELFNDSVTRSVSGEASSWAAMR